MKNILEEKILPKVTKPTRYVGGEWNEIKKDWNQIKIKMAFGFPDVYEVGMSHLGTRILYHVVNKRVDTLMERVFAPWVDMEEELRKHQVPLYTLESWKPLKEFDIIGFTLQYEMSFTNIINMLDLAGIPFDAVTRNDEEPLLIAGGPCAYNPEPIASIFDLFVIGEGEEVINDLLDTYGLWQDAGRPDGKLGLLKRLVKIPGIYVPRFYDVNYDDYGKITAIKPNIEEAPTTITKRIVKNFNEVDFPTKPIVPFMEVVHDRIMLEVLRGCARGCRFCQAGMLYRPVREKEPSTLVKQAKELVKQTGYDEISLTSLSTSDYTCVNGLVEELLDEYGEGGVSVSLPSLRIDSFSVDLAHQIQKVRKSTLTFAPEAGSQRLRDVINKGVTEENLMEATGSAFDAGWTAVKLYFMLGLPTETDEDLEGIADLANKVLKRGLATGFQKGKKGIKVTVSVSSFVPKAHTPFQWEPQFPIEELKRRQELIKSKITDRRITYNYHDAKVSVIEGVFARGDRRLGKALIKAWAKGCKFDGWTEHFKYDRWLEAFAESGIQPEEFAQRRFDYEDILPWEHINSGVSKRFLISESKQALAQATTGDCRYHNCPGCGICPDLDVEQDLKGESPR